MQKQRVADQVAERIERLIVDGVLKVGQALPSERRLVAKLGCSRSALREGLRALRGRGIIDTEHGRGSFVADLDRNADASPLMHLFGSQPRTLYDLLEVRAPAGGRGGPPGSATRHRGRLRPARPTLRRDARQPRGNPADRSPRARPPRPRVPPGDQRGIAQSGAGAYPAIAQRTAAEHGVRLSEQPLSPAAAETPDRPPARAPLRGPPRAPAGPGATGGARTYPQHPRQPAGDRAGRTAPGPRHPAPERLG